MSIRYRFNAHTRDGRDISAVLTSDTFVPANNPDVYMLPNQVIIQYNDAQTGDALSYAFPTGTFQQLRLTSVASPLSFNRAHGSRSA